MKRFFLTLSFVLFIIPIGISQNLPSYVPTDGLVAYYPFNGNANDESGNGNHGTVNGATLTSDRNDVQNSSYSFDGLDDYISINSNNNQLDFFGNCCITISAWIKLDNADNQYSILTNSDYNNIHQQYALKVESNSKLYFLAGDKLFESNGINYSSSNINNGQWAHTLVSYDGNKLKLYLNGNLDYENQIIDNFPESPSSVAFIGNSWGANNDFFPGQIDDVSIWNRALTEQEIQNLYNSSIGDILLDGIVSAENNQIKNVVDPTHSQDAATKGYVDSNINSFSGSYNDLTDKPTSFIGDVNGNITSNILKLNMLTQSEINEISPEEGMVVYNLDQNRAQIYSVNHELEIDNTSLSAIEFKSCDGARMTFQTPFNCTVSGVSFFVKRGLFQGPTHIRLDGENSADERLDENYWNNFAENSSGWHTINYSTSVSLIANTDYTMVFWGPGFGGSDRMSFAVNDNGYLSGSITDAGYGSDDCDDIVGKDFLFILHLETTTPNNGTSQLNWINLN